MSFLCDLGENRFGKDSIDAQFGELNVVFKFLGLNPDLGCDDVKDFDYDRCHDATIQLSFKLIVVCSNVQFMLREKDTDTHKVL